MSRDALTDRQEIFCHEYLKDLNGTQAAIRAGYSRDSAPQTASEILSYPHVRDRVQQLMNERAKKTGVKKDTILRRLDAIGGLDPAILYDEEGRFRSIHDLPIEVRRGIKKIKTREEWSGVGRDKVQSGEIIEIEFWDKIKANELLGRHLKMFNETVKHELGESLEALIAKSNEPPRDVTPKQIESSGGTDGERDRDREDQDVAPESD